MSAAMRRPEPIHRSRSDNSIRKGTGGIRSESNWCWIDFALEAPRASKQDPHALRYPVRGRRQ